MGRHWPSWRYGPDGQAAIFNSPAEVPRGWEDHPSKVGRESDAQDPFATVKSIEKAYAAGEVTLEQIVANEMQRQKPRASVLKFVEDRRGPAPEGKESDGEEITREEAILYLREREVEIADDATDEQIAEALEALGE